MRAPHCTGSCPPVGTKLRGAQRVAASTKVVPPPTAGNGRNANSRLCGDCVRDLRRFCGSGRSRLGKHRKARPAAHLVFCRGVPIIDSQVVAATPAWIDQEGFPATVTYGGARFLPVHSRAETLVIAVG